MVAVVAAKTVEVAKENEAFVEERFVVVTELAVSVVTPSVVIVPLVAERLVVKVFVEVELVLVTLPSWAFQRLVALPREKPRSASGTRFEFTKPVTAKFVVVPLVSVVF